MVHYFNKYSHLLLGCVIFCYLFLRVINVPISDDEFLTYREFVHGDILTILTSGKPDVYWTPNNHILNTLLIKLSLWIFGEHDWAFRIHILIAFIACYYFVFKILSNYIKSPGRILAYLGILFLNAYLLDFFSLARGYAISMAGWSAAFYYFMKYYEGAATTHNLAISWIYLFIAVWSNFSALYFLPLFGLLFLLRLLLDRKTGLNKFHLFLFPASLIVIVAVVIVPLSKAFAAGTLVWGSGNFFQDSFVASVDYYSHYNLNMGRFKMVTEHWSRMEIYALVLIIGWVFSQGISWCLKPSEPLRKVHFALLFQCVGLTVIVVALHPAFDQAVAFETVSRAVHRDGEIATHGLEGTPKLEAVLCLFKIAAPLTTIHNNDFFLRPRPLGGAVPTVVLPGCFDPVARTFTMPLCGDSMRSCWGLGLFQILRSSRTTPGWSRPGSMLSPRARCNSGIDRIRHGRPAM